MFKLARMAAVTGLAAALVGGATAPAAIASGKDSGSSKRSYECVNHGGGPNHSVDCSDSIVEIGDINIVIAGNDIDVLSGNELTVLANALNNVEVDVDVLNYLVKLEDTVVKVYQDIDIDISLLNIKTCAKHKNICV